MNNKYQLGQLVYFGNIPYWVTGVNAKIGYDHIDWEYQLTKPAYQDAEEGKANWCGGRMDVNNVDKVKEYQIKTAKEIKAERLAVIKKRQAEIDKEIKDLETERALLEQNTT